MMKKTLPYLPLVDEEKKNKLSSFCASFNNQVNNLTDVDKKRVSEFIINLVTGLGKENINISVYEELVNYLSSKLDKIEFNYYQNYIKDIKIGSITCGGVFLDDLDNLTLSERTLAEKRSYGVIPTPSDQLKINLVYDGKRIASSTGTFSSSDCDNVHIGDYYFNREQIKKENNEASLVRFSVPYVNQLEASIVSYDKSGQVINKDICVNYLDTVDGKNFYVVKQVCNGLEKLSDCKPYKEGESGIRKR